MEFEYEIPFDDCIQILNDLAEKPIIEKRRYRVHHKGFCWEIDEFLSENTGLIVAEIELTSEEQRFDKPFWIGKEVTQNPRYFNSNLIKYPYSEWK